MTGSSSHQSMAMRKLPGLFAMIFIIGLIAAGVVGCTFTQPSTGQGPATTPVAQEKPQRCPTPLYPSQARPPSIPVYPNAQQVQVQTFGKTEASGTDQFYSHGPVWLTRRTTYITTDPAQVVRGFYKDVLAGAKWRPDDQTPTPDEAYYSWGVDLMLWENPPCNATPETGIPDFLLKLIVQEASAGETQVEVLEGVILGF
jgi:hypothetical protein